MKFSKSIGSNSILLLLVLAVLVIASCQKESAEELAPNENAEEIVDLRSSLLQLVYGVPVDQVNTPESAEMYDRAMKDLTDEQISELEDIVRTQQAQMQTVLPQTEHILNTRNASETILSAGANGDDFGHGIAKNGNTLFVGAPGEGKTYVYKNNNLVQTLTGAGSFGYQVATSGNWLAVMAGEGFVANDNRVVLFKKQGNAWVEHSTIYPNFQFFTNATGSDIAMHGNRLAVLGRDIGVSGIEVYKLTGNSWSLETTLDDGDTFWWDLDIDGSTIVANGGSNIGFGIVFNPQVYIFEKANNSWELSTVALPQPGNFLARYVAIHESTIVANAAISFTQSNFIITPSSGSWAVTASFSNPNQGGQGFSQGRRLAIQGSKVVVTYPITAGFSGPGNDPNDAAFVFEESGGSWSLTETLTPSTGGLNYEYGFRAAIQGNEVIIGAPAGREYAGAVFIYD